VRLPLAQAAVVAVAVAAAPPARADGDVVAVVAEAPAAHHRVILLSMPDPVRDATAAALEPWSIAVVAIADATPETDASAAVIARARGASAVAWLDAGELLVYDDLRRQTERRAAPEPLDAVNAAAIALSIKTTLRRPMPMVAALELPPPPPPRADLVDDQVAIAPTTGGGVHGAARFGVGFPTASTAVAPTMVRFAGRLAVDVPVERRLAVAVALEGGPPSAIDNADLIGRYRDVTLGLGVEWRQPVARQLWLVPAATATLHLTRLSGELRNPGGMERVVDRRGARPGMDLELAVETGGRMRGGAALFASLSPFGERYKVRGEDVLAVPAATLGIALRISFQ
jgi:hypothetical protein